MSWRRFFQREKWDKERARELEAHLEIETQDNIARGMTPEEAGYAARRKLGNTTRVREEIYLMNSAEFFDALWRDVRYAFRTLRKNPGFTVVATLTLALGIGASTAIFSVVEAVLLRALPYPNPDKIVRVWEQAPDGHPMNLADTNFDDFRAQNHTFANLAAYEYGVSSIAGGSEPVRINVAEVSSGFFESLGVKLLRGRAFAPEEQRLHGTPAIIVSYRYWQQYLGAAADLSRVRLSMEGGVYPVIGVMPAGFDFPPGTSAWIAHELYPELGSRNAHNFRCVGRIRDGVTLEQARADLSTIARRIKEQYGKDVDLNDATVLPLADAMVGDVRTALMILSAAVGLLLLVACTNVAGLLLARTAARRKELAVRAALGAGRRRLIQQFFAESFVLSASGGVFGILVAFCAVRALPAILPANLPQRGSIAVNAQVLLFALAAIVVVSAALGFFAAWRCGAGNPQEALAAGSRSYSGAVAGRRLRGYLVSGEIATTLVILIGAGLLGRSFVRLISTSPGFRSENLITMEFSPPIPQGQWGTGRAAIARQVRQMDDIVARLSAIPGAESVGLAGAVPVAQGDNLADGGFLILKDERSPATFDDWARMAKDPAHVGHALYCVAGAAYFRTLGIPLIRGRIFGEQDDFDAPHVAVISQALALQDWPNQDPIGQEINFGNMDGNLKPLTIIGVVGDVRAGGLNRSPSGIIYVHYRQRGMNANSSPTILVRSSVPPGQIVPAARGIFREIVPDVPVRFSTFADEMGGWLADRRFLLLLVGTFAAAALALAAVGTYGVVAFSVTRRTQEIGIRMALGAERGNILRLVLGEGARMAALGAATGIAVSLAITRLMSSLLFDISTVDPLTFACVAGLVSVVALLASYIPARRAMRVDPDVALRYE